MLKFRCQHCGQRIAVGARHLGKLVTCPECGKPTHPLAEQIVSLQAPPVAVAAAVPAPPAPGAAAEVRPDPPAEPEERCANCDGVMGRLQKRNTWQDHLVCTPCHAKLSGETALPAPVIAGGAAEAEAARPLRVAARRTPREGAQPMAGPFWARGAATAGRLALAGAAVVGALAKASGTPPDAERDAAAPDFGDVPTVFRRPGIPTGYEPGADPRRAPLPLHTRLMIVLAVVCLAGAGVYGALSLLRDLTAYLTVAAFVLLAVAGGYVLLRVSLAAGRKLFPVRAAGRAGRAAASVRDIVE